MSRMTRLYDPACSLSSPAIEDCSDLPRAEQAFLLRLQSEALAYFRDNQAPHGLVLDRQRNFAPLESAGLCSLTATGMGFIALALASSAPYRLLTRSEARHRIHRGMRTVLEDLPHLHGMMPHFVDAETLEVIGVDYLSTIESAWLVVGALIAAAFLDDATLLALADQLYQRMDFHFWTVPHLADSRGLLRHGMDRHGQFLPCYWDRINGETVFMYVLAAGAENGKNLPASFWSQLQPCYGEVAGLRFNNADLGLFVFQYGLDLLDARQWRAPSAVDLAHEAQVASLANQRFCQAAAAMYGTYRNNWGLSAGDGPGENGVDVYRSYAPGKHLDGTAHITATLASLSHCPGAVLENLHQAEHDRDLKPHGRYGFSNIQRDGHWVSRDVVGIDMGATVLALDNVLNHNRVRLLFHELPCVQRGLDRLGFTRDIVNLRLPIPRPISRRLAA